MDKLFIYRRTKIIGGLLILLFMAMHSIVVAQTEDEGYLLIKNSEEGIVMLKWVGKKVYYDGGFNLYRKTDGTSSWTKLNDTPIKLAEQLPESFSKDNEAQAFYKIVKETPIAEFQTSVVRAFVLIKAIFSNDFAKVMGIAYDDKTAVSGTKYQYKAIALQDGNELKIGESEIIAGKYVESKPPKNIRLERKRKLVNMFWDAESMRYYGVNIYRTNVTTKERVLLNEKPVLLSSQENEKGEKYYPELKYIDATIDKKISYTYEINAIDYFGDESKSSEPIFVASKDFDPPTPAYNLIADPDTLTVKLNWNIDEDPDRTGINIYRSEDYEGEKILIKSNLNRNDTFYRDKVPHFGNYYYYVGTKDTTGNEAVSYPIFIEVRDVIPPMPPVNVKTKADSGKVTLNWAKNKETDLLGYFIYKSVAKETYSDADFIIVNKDPITATEYIEKMSKNVKNKFVYSIVAVDTSFNYSEKSKTSVVQLPDLIPPEKPFIKDIEGKDHKVIITWLLNVDDDLAGYNMYRNILNKDSAATKINENLIDKSTNIYTDNFISPGNTYQYYLEAVDESGNRSSYSEPYSINLESDLTEPSTVSKFKIIVRDNNKANLYWDINQKDDFLGVIVFRKTINEPFKPVTGLLTQSDYKDSDLTNGQFYYKIKSYSKSGNIAESEIIEINILEKK